VLDFGSQTSHLILRRLRALSVYAEMLPCTTKLADLTWKPKGIVLSGGKNPFGPPPFFFLTNSIGPSSVYDEGSPREISLPRT
jgi:GMP synthase (glutamine-hydrolysing)